MKRSKKTADSESEKDPDKNRPRLRRAERARNLRQPLATVNLPNKDPALAALIE